MSSVVITEPLEGRVVITEDSGRIQIVRVGFMGPQGPPGTLIEVEEDGVIKTTPLRNLDFRTGFDVTEPISRTAQIDLDLSELAAGGELGGNLDAPTVDPLHSGSTHQSITDALNAHEIDVVGAHDASAIAFTPTDTIVSADTQSAVVEALTDARAYTDDGHVILSSRRGAVDGVAELDATGKVPAIELPAFSFGEVFTVASEAEMLALAATQGDMAVRTDISATFILADDPATILANWVELLNPSSPVTSVNTRTGAVTGLEEAANKGAISGYAALDGSGYVPDAQINPAIARDTEVAAGVASAEAYSDAALAAVSPMANGAIGDGVTNDTAAITTTLAALTSGGTMVLPYNKSFAITNFTISGSDVTIDGLGYGKLISSGSTGTAVITISGNRVCLKNLTLDCTGNTRAYAIVVTGTDVLLDHVRVLGAGTDSVDIGRVALQAARGTVQNCSIDTQKVALSLDAGANDCKVLNNTFTSYRRGVYLQNDITNTLVDGNRFLSVGGSGVVIGHDAILAEGPDNYVLSNNIVEAAREHGIYNSSYCSNGVITGNVISGHAHTGIKMLGGATRHHDMTVVGNMITGGGQDGAASIECGFVDRFTISANTVYNSTSGEGIRVSGGNRGGTVEGNHVEACFHSGIDIFDIRGAISNLSVVGNTVLNTGTNFPGIRLHATTGNAISDVLISNNLCSDNQGSPTQYDGVLLSAVTGGSTASNITVQGNRGMGNTTALLEIATGYTALLVDSYGTGSPESVMYGSVGSKWTRTDSTVAATYIKQSGDGTNTGWIAHEAVTADAHDASAISFAPTGTIASTDVQTAIAEVASEASGVVVTTGRYFPEDYAGANDAVKVQAAADAAFAAGGLLVLQPGKTYVIPTGVTFKCDVDGRASKFSWTGGASGVCVSCGDGSSTQPRLQHKRMVLPQIVHASPGYTGTDIAVRVWALQRSTVYFGAITGFTVGVLTIGGAGVAATNSWGPVQNNQFFFDFIGASSPLRVEGGLSWNNENNYHGGLASITTGNNTHRNIHVRYTPVPPVFVSLRTDSTAGQVDAGSHMYFFTYIDVNGNESGAIHPGVFSVAGTGPVVNDASHTSNAIVVPPLSDFHMVGLPDAASINLYRSKVGAVILTGNMFRVAASLTPSTTYIDTATDASLPAIHPGGPQHQWGKPDTHRFYDINVEGYIADYAVECEGSYCLFNWLRYEQVGAPKFRGVTSYFNTVYGGLASNLLTITEADGAHDNVLIPAGGTGPANRSSFAPSPGLVSTTVQAAIEAVAAQHGERWETLVGASLATGPSGLTPITTASITPASSVVFVVVTCALVTGAPTVTSISGLGGTWSEITTVAGLGGTQARLSIWIGTGCSGSGALTITQSAAPTSGRYSVLQFTGIDTVNPYVASSAKSQVGVSAATQSGITPNALARAGNAILTATRHGIQEDVVPLGAGVELDDTNISNSGGMETEYLIGATGTVGGSWATSTNQYMTLGIEIQAKTAGFQIPYDLAPSQSGEGHMLWDSDDNHLTVGTGAGRKTLANSDDTLAAIVTFLSTAKWGTN